MPEMKDDARRMHEMYKARDLNGVLAFINSGVDPNARDEYGDALLHKAIRNELFVKALIKAGADVNVRVRCRWIGFVWGECATLMLSYAKLSFLVSMLISKGRS